MVHAQRAVRGGTVLLQILRNNIVPFKESVLKSRWHDPKRRRVIAVFSSVKAARPPVPTRIARSRTDSRLRVGPPPSHDSTTLRQRATHAPGYYDVVFCDATTPDWRRALSGGREGVSPVGRFAAAFSSVRLCVRLRIHGCVARGFLDSSSLRIALLPSDSITNPSPNNRIHPSDVDYTISDRNSGDFAKAAFR